MGQYVDHKNNPLDAPLFSLGQAVKVLGKGGETRNIGTVIGLEDGRYLMPDRAAQVGVHGYDAQAKGWAYHVLLGEGTQGEQGGDCWGVGGRIEVIPEERLEADRIRPSEHEILNGSEGKDA